MPRLSPFPTIALALTLALVILAAPAAGADAGTPPADPKWFHVCEHESNHNGQMKLIAGRLSGARKTGE